MNFLKIKRWKRFNDVPTLQLKLDSFSVSEVSIILQYPGFALKVESLKFTVFPTTFLGTELFKEVNVSHVNTIFLSLLKFFLEEKR